MRADTHTEPTQALPLEEPLDPAAAEAIARMRALAAQRRHETHHQQVASRPKSHPRKKWRRRLPYADED